MVYPLMLTPPLENFSQSCSEHHDSILKTELRYLCLSFITNASCCQTERNLRQNHPPFPTTPAVALILRAGKWKARNTFREKGNGRPPVLVATPLSITLPRRSTENYFFLFWVATILLLTSSPPLKEAGFVGLGGIIFGELVSRHRSTSPNKPFYRNFTVLCCYSFEFFTKNYEGPPEIVAFFRGFYISFRANQAV